jgi:hypothetical protein
LWDTHLSNIYGRATFTFSNPELAKALGHRKLSRAFTDTPQGGFRASHLAHRWSRGLVLTEAVLDALALEIIMDGYEGICSLAGTHNPEFLEEIAFCGSEILLAYDHDQAGRDATKRAFKQILTCNPQARVTDFSADFREVFHELFPEPSGAVFMKDWNKILIERPHIRFRL